MDDLKFNKYAAGVLCGLLLIMAGVKIADVLLPHQELAEDAYPFDVAATAQTDSTQTEAPKGADPILAMLAAADIAAGEKTGKKCAACHSFNEGGKTKIGPNLWNIVNAPVARDSGFSYSGAMADLGGVWSYTALNHFFYKPKQWLKGTKMNFAGVKKAEDRANVIAWLRSLSSSPADFPSAEEIAAEESNP
jgi:cytochrome c